MNTRTLITAFALLVLALPARAEPELAISAKGELHISNVNIGTRHSLNLFSVNTWGLKWVVPIDKTTILEAADGAKIEFSQVLDDHRLEIWGPVVIGDIRRPGWIDTRKIRDLSIGTPPVITALPPPQTATIGAGVTPPPPAPASTPPPSTSSGQAPPAPVAGGYLTQNLKLGMRGREVVLLQEFLQKNGWGIPNDGPVTGYYGKVTVNAVKKFQAANSLPAEGEVGPKTRALINELLSKP
ncbi:MAG: peptidoglycan-binding domain-containing protein [bacterium]|nr:peptidoglycan-binding domain-containing protein [bacterium]